MKKIITLGHSASGKSCYMSVAISYLFRKAGELRLFTKSDTNLDKLTDETVDIMQGGQWPGKTLRKMSYCMERRNRWNVFLDSCKIDFLRSYLEADEDIELIDWPGEAFTAAGREWGKSADEAWRELGSDVREAFVQDCEDADAFLLFLDGENLLKDGSKISKTRDCLYWLKKRIETAKKDRKFVILITKSDYLEGTEEFGDQAGHVYSKEISKFVRDRFNSFFATLGSNNYEYLVMPVTCIPMPDHRKETDKATVPTKKWELSDLEYSNIADPNPENIANHKVDMITPFRWIMSNL